MPIGHSVNEAEWKGKVESQIDTLTTGFVTLNAKVDKIFDVVNRSQKTDWNTIFAGCLVIGALYAATIRPVENDVDRSNKTAEKLAEAVLVQNDKITSLEVNQKVNTFELSNERDLLKDITDHNTTN